MWTSAVDCALRPSLLRRSARFSVRSRASSALSRLFPKLSRRASLRWKKQKQRRALGWRHMPETAPKVVCDHLGLRMLCSGVQLCSMFHCPQKWPDRRPRTPEHGREFVTRQGERKTIWAGAMLLLNLLIHKYTVAGISMNVLYIVTRYCKLFLTWPRSLGYQAVLCWHVHVSSSQTLRVLDPNLFRACCNRFHPSTVKEMACRGHYVRRRCLPL